MKFTQLGAFQEALQSQQLFPLYTIISKNPYEKQQITEILLQFLLKNNVKRQHTLKNLNSQDLTLSILSQELNTLSFFAPKRIICINEAENLAKPILGYLEKAFSSLTLDLQLIITATEINRATKFYKSADKYGMIVDIAEEKPWEKEKKLLNWIMEKLSAEGKKITPQACQAILKQSGSDQSLLHQELEKLLCYVGNRNQITIQDISAICAHCNIETIWQLGEAIFRRDAASALRISKALLEDGTHLIALLKQLRFQFQAQFQICSILKNGGNAGMVAKEFPYMKGAILDKNINSALQFGLDACKNGLIAIDEAEVMAKNSQTDLGILGDLLIIKLC